MEKKLIAVPHCNASKAQHSTGKFITYARVLYVILIG
jgi:hypothetical protein